MFVAEAQQFSADQINTFIMIVGSLVLANLGNIVGWAYRSLRKNIKGEADIKAAHDKIRILKSELEQVKKQLKGE